MTTKRQKAAVLFCVEWAEAPFKGDINNKKQVSDYLSENLDDAKSEYSHAYECYSEEAIRRDLDMERYY